MVMPINSTMPLCCQNKINGSFISCQSVNHLSRYLNTNFWTSWFPLGKEFNRMNYCKFCTEIWMPWLLIYFFAKPSRFQNRYSCVMHLLTKSCSKNISCKYFYMVLIIFLLEKRKISQDFKLKNCLMSVRRHVQFTQKDSNPVKNKWNKVFISCETQLKQVDWLMWRLCFCGTLK